MFRSKSLWSLVHSALSHASSPALAKSKEELKLKCRWYLGEYDRPWVTKTFGQTLFWLWLWGWSCMWLTFKLIDWVKQIALPKLVGLTQSVDDLNKTADPPLSKREFYLPECCWSGTLFCLVVVWLFCFFLAFSFKLKHQLFPDLLTEPHHWLPWVSSLLTVDFGSYQSPESH